MKQRDPATLIVDGAHLLLELYRQARSAESEDRQRIEAETVGMSFLANLGLAVSNGGFDFYERNGRLSIYVFDAQKINVPFVTSAIGAAPPRAQDEELWHRIWEKRMSAFKTIVSGQILFPGDPGWEGSDHDGGFQVHFSKSVDPHVGTALDVPSSPGVYFGYLAERGEHGFTQKAVDSMITLCGALKAQEGRSVVLISADADFIPLANYVLEQGQRFFLLHCSPISDKWQVFSKAPGFKSIPITPALLRKRPPS